jgi:GT2 family glycosyltransferase
MININPKIGMVSGKILDGEGGRIDSAGQLLSKYRKPVERGYKELDRGQFDEEGYIFGVCGMVAFYRKKMLKDIKVDGEYFDSTYKMFYEDLDLNWRAQRFGWRAYYNPKAVAYHRRGSSARMKSNIRFLNQFYFPYLSQELKFHLIKNRYMTMIKNEDVKNFILNLYWILSYDLALWFYVLVKDPELIFKILINRKYFKIAFNKRSLINSMI